MKVYLRDLCNLGCSDGHSSLFFHVCEVINHEVYMYGQQH